MSVSRKNVLVATAALALSSIAQVAPVHAASEAGYGSVLRTNAKGREVCRSLEAAGGTYWKGKVSGRMDDFSRRSLLSDKFNVRSCFTSEAKCLTFINRIEHTVYPIEEIYYANCRIAS